MVIDICGAPEKIPWPVEIVVPYERDLDALGVCVLGEFKVGKTFLINHLCNLKLSSIESIHTRGLSFKRGRPPRDQVVWIDTAGHGCPYDIRKETVEERNGVESLLSEMAYKLADVRIVVVSNCKLREQDFIFAIHKQLKDDAVPGKDLLIVVHNYTRIGDPDLLYSSFQNDVVQRFHIQEVSIPYASTAPPRSACGSTRATLIPSTTCSSAKMGPLQGTSTMSRHSTPFLICASIAWRTATATTSSRTSSSSPTTGSWPRTSTAVGG
eukprot:TRINITY_DN2461_c0_g1_i1.p1 TRINITY_DN2461_c0_g1~~TRINITY_DN2461_c0_g1_i1.p1  ORF type:complete len:268 (+),score=39.79 TRINITY_DN2461_c0_g1_i1:167-970(+)